MAKLVRVLAESYMYYTQFYEEFLVLARDSGEYFSFVQLIFSHINFSVAECFPH